MKNAQAISLFGTVLLFFSPTAQAQGFVNSLGMKMVPVPGTKILMATKEVTVDQYKKAGLGYRAPTFPQTGKHPAVYVSWNDAKAYCAWLSKKEGKKYRLPTDHEWSCAVGIGHLENPQATPVSKSASIADVYPWGRGKPSGKAGNYMGQEWNTAAARAEAHDRGYREGSTLIPGYNDGVLFTAPVGSYSPNNLGIYDLGGNVWEWCEDGFDPMKTAFRVLRGGSFKEEGRTFMRSSYRSPDFPDARFAHNGFRLVCENGSER